MRNLLHALTFLLHAVPAADAEPARLEDFASADPARAELGHLLFWDPLLSGNRNISCATCHHPDFGSSDGVSLGIGEGGRGVGPARTSGEGSDRIRKRIPRNAQGLWNLGHESIRVMFHDGRLEISDQFGNGFDSPAEEWLPQGLDSILAAQAIFPLIAEFEMAGNVGENEIIGAVRDRIDYGWPLIADRVRGVPEYGDLFAAAFDHIDGPADITIVDIGNAIGAFMAVEWISVDSPYDDWLANGVPLSDAAERGREIFFGRGNCSSCHSGPLFTDQDFHALGLPAFGPGRTRRFDPMPRDVGRMGETDLAEDAYRFRTPSLRNIAVTGPYGHNGAFSTLDAVIRHHSDPVASLAAWREENARLPDAPWLADVDFAVRQDRFEMARQAAMIDIVSVPLDNAEVADLVAFLRSLTGATVDERPFGKPDIVPSGLPIDD